MSAPTIVSHPSWVRETAQLDQYGKPVSLTTARGDSIDLGIEQHGSRQPLISLVVESDLFARIRLSPADACQLAAALTALAVQAVIC